MKEGFADRLQRCKKIVGKKGASEATKSYFSRQLTVLDGYCIVDDFSMAPGVAHGILYIHIRVVNSQFGARSSCPGDIPGRESRNPPAAANTYRHAFS